MSNQLSARELIEHISPPRIRSLMGHAIRQGYEHVNYALSQFDFFNWEVGQQIRGYAQLITIQWVLREMAEKQVIPFKPLINLNARKNYAFLELHTEGALIAIARSDDPGIPGRYAKLREVRSSNNYLPLFDIEDDDRPGFLLLCFGASGVEPDFGRIGVPTEGCRSWYDHEDVLKVARGVAAEVTDIADPREAVKHALEVINNAAKESACASDPGQTS